MSKLTKLLATLCLSFIFVLSVSFVGYSQSSTATLSGTIEDESGAVIPGAAIAVVNEATSFKRTATTNESGSFTIPLLPPGEYTVLVEREGFTRVQLTNIVLNVGDQKAIQVQLKVGDVQSTVEVRPDASLIDTGGDVGTVIDSQFVRNIPLNGRSFQSLLALTPGVVLTAGNTTGQFSVNGQRPNSNYFTIDGVGANNGSAFQNNEVPGIGASGQLPDLTVSGTTASLVAVDALQEFRIQTSSYAPEFGRTPGGQVQLVTRSGTNDYHGTVFDYFRNEAFDANDWFANRSGAKRPPTRQHQFGGTFGGPLPFFNFGDGGGPLLRSGKDRTHFFFSYEGLRLRLPKFLESSVPTMCFRGSAACEGGRTPAATAHHSFLKVFPVPNGAEVMATCATNEVNPLCTTISPGVRVKPSGFARYAVSYSEPTRYDATSLRIDHTAGKFTFFGRYNQTPSSSTVRPNSAYISTSFGESRGVTLGSTWSPARHIVNDIRFNYSTNNNSSFLEAGDIDGGLPLETFGFVGRTPETGRFSFSISGLPAPTTSITFASGTISDFEQRQFNIVENLLWTAGEHQVKFGMDFRRGNPYLITSLLGGEGLNVTLAQLSAGQLQSYSLSNYDNEPHAPVFDNLSLYAQDTWRISKRLTLTYGVRWEFVPPPHASEGPEAVTLDGLDATDLFAPNVLSVAPMGTPLWEKRYNNFAPRIGASFLLVEKPGRELVIRGGVGVFYDLGLGNSAQGYGLVWPNTTSLSYPIVGHPDPGCRPPLVLPLPTCAFVTPELGIAPPGSISIMDREVMLPRVYQWNFSAEQSLGTHQSLTFSYVGAAGRKLISTSTYRDIRLRGFTYAGSGGSLVQLQRNAGFSNYQSLQLQFQRRLSKGFQALAAYTYSISKDTESADDIGGLQPETVPTSYRYGYSNYDLRHNFNAAVTYEIPGLKSGGAFLKALTRDWGVDAKFSIRSGFPVDVRYSGFLPGIPNQIFIRPNIVDGQPFWQDDPSAPGGRRVNLLAFSMPAPGTFGSLPRGIVRGFGARQLDLSLHRDFPLSEQWRLQLRADVFNVPNTPNFFAGAFTIGASSVAQNFGAATAMLNRSSGAAGSLNALYGSGGPRSMQFSARISF